MLDLACKDTIFAQSTAAGRAAIAIVRVSGPNALRILSKLFVPYHRNQIQASLAMHGEIRSASGKVLDDAMAIYFAGSKGYTGEDAFEIHCHGSPLIVEDIQEELSLLGARLAQPGEFSLRAVLNEKLDLCQAESVADLINAQSRAAQTVALRNLKGGLSEKIQPYREKIVQWLCEIEARMDFPDEDLGRADHGSIAEDICNHLHRLESWLKTAGVALKLQRGFKVVLCGKPNAGKSTLLNALCGEDRAIVHHTPGTTRDVLEASFDLEGLHITLLDVAGIRSQSEANDIEAMGIERALKALQSADAILWLCDGSAENPFADEEIRKVLKGLSAPIVQICTKSDAYEISPSSEYLIISAKTGHGLADLKKYVRNLVLNEEVSPSDLFITRARQKEELVSAQKCLKNALEALRNGLVDEVVASELRLAGACFDRLLGTSMNEDVLDRIFSQFCIGK